MVEWTDFTIKLWFGTEFASKFCVILVACGAMCFPILCVHSKAELAQIVLLDCGVELSLVLAFSLSLTFPT